MKFKVILAAAALAVTPFMSSAATFANADVVQDVGFGTISVDFGATPLTGANDLEDALNLQDAANEFEIEARIVESGTLSIDTFVDPFIGAGSGSGQVLLSIGEVLPAGSVVVTWGESAPVDISDGSTKMLTTFFDSIDDIDTLMVSWSGLSSPEQLSINIAAVPLPAGMLLLGTALAGLGFARRRKS